MKILEILNKINRNEWRFLVIVIIILIAVTTGPYLYAYFNSPQGYFYTGKHSLTPGDFSVYFSYINQIKSGQYFINDYFTSEEQGLGTLNIFWLMVGKTAQLFNLSPLFAFHLFRVILIPVLIIELYIFIGYFISEIYRKKITLLLLSFASGLGGVTIFFFNSWLKIQPKLGIYRWPIDLWVPESNIFLTLYHSPHLIMSLIMMLAVFGLIILSFDTYKYRYSIIAGGLGLIWFNFHPYYFPYAATILFFWAMYEFINVKKLFFLISWLIFIAISLPSVIYHYVLIKTDFVSIWRAAQNICLMPPIAYVAVGFGLLAIFALIGIVRSVISRQFPKKFIYLLIWLMAGIALCYSPFLFQRRFLAGLEIPMILLGVLGLLYIIKIGKFNKKTVRNYFLLLILIVLLTNTNLFVMIKDLVCYHDRNEIYYQPNELKAAAFYIDKNNSSRSVILTSETLGNLIPALINQQVFIGHGNEALFYKQKRVMMFDFFTNQYSDEQAVDFLKQNNIGYILFSELERRGQFDPSQKKYLERVFEQGQLQVYKIK